MSLYRTVKEDFELHGKRIKKGAVILASLMYAKACDPRVSAGDHADSALPRHMDIGQLDDSFKPERWLDDSNKLDTSVRPTAHPLFEVLPLKDWRLGNTWQPRGLLALNLLMLLGFGLGDRTRLLAILRGKLY